jgi:hypothetical protein
MAATGGDMFVGDFEFHSLTAVDINLKEIIDVEENRSSNEMQDENVTEPVTTRSELCS